MDCTIIGQKYHFVSNITILENLSLILGYNKSKTLQQSRELVLISLEKLGLLHTLNLRPFECNHEELAYLMFIRSSFVNKPILVNRLFVFVGHIQNIKEIIDKIEPLNFENKITFLDLQSFKDRYIYLS